jgi:tetratricopeptide (TPR) repeat protein
MVGALATTASVAVLGGCATAIAPALPGAAEIPGLETTVATSPRDVGTLVRLGVAYHGAGRFEEAKSLLERAVALDATEPAGVYYLGLTHEALGSPAEARAVYTRYLAVGTDANLRRTIEHRFPILERQELLLAARAALGNETVLSRTPPQAGTVAVFPFAYEGRDPTFEPLSRALAEMVVTDLSQTSRIRVLERMRLQLLIDEMNLGETGLFDPLTAARSGRLVGAERIVQGQLNIPTADEARLQAVVVGVSTGTPGTPLVESDALRRLFDAQKRLVFSLYSSLGVQLSPAERDRVSRVPTQNLQALLAYGQCLEADDAGNYEEAATECARAAALDPEFTEARNRAEQADAALSNSLLSLQQLAQLGVRELAGAGISSAAQFSDLNLIQRLVPSDLARIPAMEVFGTDPGRFATIDLIINSPTAPQ